MSHLSNTKKYLFVIIFCSVFLSGTADISNIHPKNTLMLDIFDEINILRQKTLEKEDREKVALLIDTIDQRLKSIDNVKGNSNK